MRKLLLLAALMFAVPAHAVSVYLPPSPGFKVGHQASNGRAVLVELVPVRESVTAFSRMITLQTAPNMGRVPVGNFLAEFGKRYIARCPGATVAPVVLGGGATGMRIACSRHPATGRPETVFARALVAGPDMALVHITMKSIAMPQDAMWARDYIGRVRPQ